MLTPCPAAADAVVRWVLGVAPNVSDFRIEQSLPLECFPVLMLDAPEAARRNSCLLRSLWQSLSGAIGAYPHGGGGEGTH